MNIFRPEVLALARRGREVIWAGLLIAAGSWLVWLGGYLLGPTGVAVMALGAGWALMAWRRMRFGQGNDAPGLVEVDEAQIGYFGPASGGFVSLPDLVELRLITMRGRRLWRLKQSDGQALLIPVDTTGADRLFDAFASLPGMDTGVLVAALDPATAAAPGSLTAPLSELQVIWRRKGAGVVIR